MIQWDIQMDAVQICEQELKGLAPMAAFPALHHKGSAPSFHRVLTLQAPLHGGQSHSAYLAVLRDTLREELEKSQQKQKWHYNEAVHPRTFIPGQKVLLLLPSSENKLLMGWQGPYELAQWVGEVNYHIKMPRRGECIFHVNLLKKWKTWKAEGLYGANRDWDSDEIAQSAELRVQMKEGVPISTWQTHQIQQILEDYSDIFSDSLRLSKGSNTTE